MRRMATRLFQSMKLGASFSSESRFPKLSKEQIEANWALVKSLVVPRGKTLVNAARGGSKTNSTLNYKSGAIPKNLHITAAKNISKNDTVYIEEGDFQGIDIKIVTGEEGLASSGRAVLGSSHPTSNPVTVLLCSKTDLSGTAYYDPAKRLLVANELSEQVLNSLKAEFKS